MIMKTILPGQKVKIYCSKKEVQFGEVLGIGFENKIIVARRSDFQTLRVCDFDLFREASDVVFINGSQFPIMQP